MHQDKWPRVHKAHQMFPNKNVFQQYTILNEWLFMNDSTSTSYYVAKWYIAFKDGVEVVRHFLWSIFVGMIVA